MGGEQAAISQAKPAPMPGGLSREMEDEVYGMLGALLGMLEVLLLDVTDPLAPRQRRFLDEALRFGDKLRARVEAMVILLSAQGDEHHKAAEYSLRRLIDHAVRGASWSATEKGVALALPMPALRIADDARPHQRESQEATWALGVAIAWTSSGSKASP